MNEILNDLKDNFNKISNAKLAFTVGSFNKRYFSKVSDIDIIVILDKEDSKTAAELSKIKRKLEAKYKRQVDFMINTKLELEMNNPLCELNEYVISLLKNNRYTIIKNELNLDILNKDKKESIIQDSRYYMNKVRNIFMGESFIIRGRYKVLVGKERTKVLVSAIFNILRRYILIKYNKYIDEYDDTISILRTESESAANLIEELYKLKREGIGVDKSRFKETYDYISGIYNYILENA